MWFQIEVPAVVIPDSYMRWQGLKYMKKKKKKKEGELDSGNSNVISLLCRKDEITVFSGIGEIRFKI